MVDAMGNVYGKTAAIDFGVQWTCWAVASALKTEKFFDLVGSSTYLLLAYQTLKWGKTFHLRQRVHTGLVAAWAIRLGLFLFSRVMKEGHDSRFDKVRGKPGTFFQFWTVQGVWVFMTLLPTIVLNSKKEDKPLGTRDYIGWGMWLTGFFLEVVADYQKSAFKSNPANQGKFINQGLWSLCRHPNYLGEIMMWTGLYINASSVMTRPLEYASVISPLFLTFLLTQVSGIPIQERQGMKRWGNDPEYLNYLKKTAKLVPYIW